MVEAEGRVGDEFAGARARSKLSPVQRRLDRHLPLVVVLRIVVAPLAVASEAVASGRKALAVQLEASAVPTAT